MVLCLLCIALVLPEAGRAQSAQRSYVYRGAALQDVIADIEASSAYRFLYRDALVSGKRVTMEAGADAWLPALEAALRSQRLALQVDSTHRQVVLFEARAAPVTAAVAGHVLDGESGARLPFATLSWTQDGHLRGVTTNEAGTFRLSVDAHLSGVDTLTVTASYVGYRAAQVRIPLRSPAPELSIRLLPDPVAGQEVVISSSVLATDLDTTWQHLIQPDLFAPLGEASVIRSLQPLPSVSLTPTLADGLYVRGSRADGFQILLDGIPIYNQQHFFGLFDAFNSDALQTVGFFYDVAPAAFSAPPGGTLSFVTRTGSQAHVGGTVGTSTTAARATLEGPLAGGSGSWLVSGRHSFLDAVPWLRNADLVALGLDTDRDNSLGDDLIATGTRAYRPIDATARFYDLHGKFYYETARGRRQMLTAYLGGNHTRQDAERFKSTRVQGRVLPRVGFEPVTTENRWGNEAASFQVQHPLGRRAYAASLAALSHYRSAFDQSDFGYSRLLASGERRPFLAPFAYENTLYDLKLSQQFDVSPAYDGLWTAGYTLNGYAIRYEERSAERVGFVTEPRSLQSDVFAEYEHRIRDAVHLRAGLRAHYFSNGNHVRLSPRAQFHVRPGARVSARLGYSRNYQFLHHLFLQNTNSSSIWIMTTESQGPGSADNLTAGLYLKAGRSTFLQVEGYTKAYTNVRQHEINAPIRQATQASRRFTPWYHDNEVAARGMEAMVRQEIGGVRTTAAYTWSKTEIRNEVVEDGAWLPAEWDRRHQVTATLDVPLPAGFAAHLAWSYATGNPNVLAYDDPTEPERLPAYHRLDATLSFEVALDGSVLEARAAVYNVYDRANTWYRDALNVWDPAEPRQGPYFLNVDVYDLGLHPSFDVAFHF